MKIKSLFNSIDNLSPRFNRQENPTASPERLGKKALSNFRQNDLLHPPDNSNDQRYVLASSIDTLNHQDLSWIQRRRVRQNVKTGAESFAADVIPVGQASTLEAHDRPQQVTEFQSAPPSLEDVLLLVRAYDATQDEKLLYAVDYILQTAPPAFSELLTDAYRLAKEHGTPIMSEFQRLMAETDVRLDEPDEDQYRVVMQIRNATSSKYQKKPDDDLDRTKA